MRLTSGTKHACRSFDGLDPAISSHALQCSSKHIVNKLETMLYHILHKVKLSSHDQCAIPIVGCKACHWMQLRYTKLLASQVRYTKLLLMEQVAASSFQVGRSEVRTKQAMHTRSRYPCSAKLCQAGRKIAGNMGWRHQEGTWVNEAKKQRWKKVQ